MAFCVRCEQRGRSRVATESWNDEPCCSDCFDAQHDVAHRQTVDRFFGDNYKQFAEREAREERRRW
jgi:hypothetical protein